MNRNLAISFMLITSMLLAQTGINITNPRAALDVSATNAGLILPTINIENLTNSTIINPQGGNIIDGTLIYSSDLINNGVYFWQNSLWNKLENSNLNNSTQEKSEMNPLSISVTDYTKCSNVMTVTNNRQLILLNGGQYSKISLPVNNLSGKVCSVTIYIDLKAKHKSDIELFLISPSNKVIELSTNNGNLNTNDFQVTFDDNAINNIVTTRDIAGIIRGTFKPEGKLVPHKYGLIPNINNLAGFIGDNPNGNWQLVIGDTFQDTNSTSNPNNILFRSTSLKITTSNTELNYKLLDQKQIQSLTGKNILVTSSYSANANKQNIQTVITRTKNQPISEFNNNEVILSVTNSSKTNQMFTNLNNLALDTEIEDNITYYYQLWSKGGPITTNNTNMQYNFTIKTINK